MPIDANILLQGRPADISGAFMNGLQSGQQFKNARVQNKLLDMQTQEQQIRNDEAGLKLSKEQFGDMAMDAAKIRPLIESGDTLRANVLIAERIKKIQDRGGDPSDTIALRDQLNAGNVKGVLGELKTVEDLATRVGIFDNGTGASNRSFAPVPMTDENGNFTGYAVPTVDASGKATMQPISGSERALSPIDLAMARENIGVQGYGQRRQIEAATAPIIAGGETRARLGVEQEIRPNLEASIEDAKTTAKIGAERKGGIIKAISDEKEVSRILDIAEPLLSKATESLAGSAIDSAGRMVGLSTEGSKAAAQLRTLEGQLIMKMPRMEGPQSNMDQQLYRQMAAQIGDPTTPAEERQAAVDVLRALNSRYSQSAAPSGPVPDAPGNQTKTSKFTSSTGIQFTVEQ